MVRFQSFACLLFACVPLVLPAGAAAQPAHSGAPRPVSAAMNTKALVGEVERLYQRGQYDAALPVAERLLKIREKALGPNHQDVSEALTLLGAIHLKKRDYAEAERWFVRALAVDEKVLGPDHPDVVVDLQNLAALYERKGEPGRAEPLLLRALAIQEKTLPPADPNLLAGMRRVARFFRERKDMRAEPLYLRLLAASEQQSPPDEAAMAESLGALGVLYLNEADFERAEPALVRALELRERTLGKDHPDVARELNNLGELYREQAQYGRAEPFYERALAIRERALGPDHPDLALALNNLATLCEEKGDYTRAEALYLRALRIKEKALRPDHISIAIGLNNLAHLYKTKGDYMRAEPLYRRGLAIRKKALGPGDSRVGVALNNLADLLSLRGNDTEAKPLYERALAIFEKALGPDHPLVASALGNLATIHLKQGSTERAEPLFQRALSIREKALGPTHPGVAVALHNLAFLRMMKTDLAGAEPLFLRAHDVWEHALGPRHALVATSLYSLSRFYLAKNDQAKAIEMAARAGDIREYNISLVVAAGSEAQKQAYMAPLVDETFATISLHTRAASRSHAAARLSLSTIFRRKGRVLDAVTSSMAGLRRRASPEDRALLDRLLELRSRIAALVLVAPGEDTGGDHAARVKKLTAEAEAIESKISARSQEFRIAEQPVTIERIQANIPEGTALVEIVFYHPLDPDPQGGGWAAPRYVAYILRPSGDPAWVDLGEARPIDQAVAALRQALSSPRSTDTAHLLRRVDAKVMGPIQAVLGDVHTVLVSPDGALNLIPFGALLDEQGHYRVEHSSFSYLTTGRDLLRLAIPSPRSGPPIVMANPTFGATAAASPQDAAAHRQSNRPASALRMYFKPLPGTAEEAQGLAKLLPNASLATETQATESALKHVHGPRILHIATHGFFLDTQASAPVAGRGLILDPEKRTMPRKKIDHPLLKSGLALSGANGGGTDGEDGVLTALEAAGLDLWGTKLVVLSACETGIGDVKNGEGVYGLRRALVIAGAESQVMSLWKVDDEATKDLMLDFYRHLQQGKGRTEALRQAQLAMLARDEQRSPYYWASFIPSGAWWRLDGSLADPVVPRVAPAARGCACIAGTEAPNRGSRSAALVLALCAILLRRSTGRRTRHGWDRNRSHARIPARKDDARRM